MLKSLTVINFALLDHVFVEFNDGLNILTGETGAGKSILIDALSAALGNRLSVDFIRTSCEYLRIEAVFDIVHNKTLKELLDAQDITLDEESTLIISRRLSRHGKNSIMANGCHITLATLRQIGEKLIDMHGQHEHQALLRPDSYLPLIDAYDAAIKPKLEHYQVLYDSWLALKKQITTITEHSREYTQRMDMLSWQVQEISAAALSAGEDEALEQEAKLLTHAEKISNAANKAYVLLDQGNDGMISILQLLSDVKKELDIAAQYDSKLQKNLMLVTDVLYQMEECSGELRDYLEAFEFNPHRLAKIQDRLDIIDKLKRKYAMGIADILAYYDKAEKEISVINNHEQIMEDLSKKLAHTEKLLLSAANELSLYRKKAASTFTEQIVQHLNDLGMPHASFLAQWTKTANVTSSGQDEVLFLLSANPGEAPKPLYKIASGGELSRIALAMKTVCAHNDDISTMIFDEIDAGIGGQTAQMVAEKIALVALEKQVICITHSPVIACMADSHIFIEKILEDKRTNTTIRLLTNKERLLEITRMISGNNFSQIAKDNAAEIMENAKRKKEKWKNNA